MFPGSPRLLQEEDWSGVVGKRDSGHPGVVNFRQHSHREVLPGEDLGVRRETKEVEKRVSTHVGRGVLIGAGLRPG